MSEVTRYKAGDLDCDVKVVTSHDYDALQVKLAALTQSEHELEEKLSTEKAHCNDMRSQRDALTAAVARIETEHEHDHKWNNELLGERDTLRAALATLYRMYGDNDDHHPDDCPLDCHWHQVRMALATAQGKEEAT